MPGLWPGVGGGLNGFRVVVEVVEYHQFGGCHQLDVELDVVILFGLFVVVVRLVGFGFLVVFVVVVVVFAVVVVVVDVIALALSLSSS